MRNPSLTQRYTRRVIGLSAVLGGAGDGRNSALKWSSNSTLIRVGELAVWFRFGGGDAPPRTLLAFQPSPSPHHFVRFPSGSGHHLTTNPGPGPRPPGPRACAREGDDPAITGEPPEERAPGPATNVPRLSRTGRVRPDTAANERPASRFRCPSHGRPHRSKRPGGERRNGRGAGKRGGTAERTRPCASSPCECSGARRRGERG